MKTNKSGLIIGILLLIIFILGMFILYLFVIRPAITSRTVDTYNRGIEYAIFTIMQQVARCQQVPLTFGNQTINVIAVECLQAPSQEVPEG